MANAEHQADGPVLVRRHVSAAVGMNRFFGRLEVTTGEVLFEPEGVGNRLTIDVAPTVRHRGDSVVVVHGRFGLPWMNTGIVLTDENAIGQSTATLQFPGWQRSTIINALQQAGFQVEVYATAFSAGGHIGSMTELERFRRERHARS